MDYVRDPRAIYEQSFATIRREADLSRFGEDEKALAVRLIHACGMVDIASDLVVSPGAVLAGRQALTAGLPVICDTRMVVEGIVRRILPGASEVFCAVSDAETRVLAEATGQTRSAAAIERLRDNLGNAIIAIGNAPTALFRLLEGLDEGWPKPAVILGFPVGFVGAAESKAELVANSRGVPFIALKGRRGGSALAAAAVNALAGGLSI